MLVSAQKQSKFDQNGWGGRRPGAGRPKGAKDKLLTLIENRPADIDPIDYLLSIMRDESQPPRLRLRVAKWLMPYCHPKLKATTIRAESDVQIQLVSWAD